MQMLSKTALLGGVSALAVMAALPIPAQAADLRPKAYQAPLAPQPVSPWTVWLEGGAQGVSGGDSSISGLTPPFTPGKKTWGWSGAIGVDYRLDPFWHVSADFRYGQNKSRTTNGIQTGSLCVGSVSGHCSVTKTAAGATSATRKESNWLADFMVGRDLGLGGGPLQIKFGLRVAQIRGTTDGAGLLATTLTPSPSNAKFTYHQTNRWTGAGPRLAVEGSAPLTGSWSLDYMGGIAVLFGQQSVQQTASATKSISTNVCVAGCPVAAAFVSDNAVFNADGMLGIGYAFTPASKLSLNYRVDYYNDALKVLNSVGVASNASRLYHGPNLRLTVNF